MTVRSLFKRKHRWTKGAAVRGAGNKKCYCLIGALEHVYGTDGCDAIREQQRQYNRARDRVIAAIKVLFPARYRMFSVITSFNDNADTTLDDVRKVCRLARV